MRHATTLRGVKTPQIPLLAAALLVAVLAGCSARSTSSAKSVATHTSGAAAVPAVSPTSSPAAEPRTYDAAKAAVDKTIAATKARDGGTAWDMLTSAGQAAMSRADYIKVIDACPKFAANDELVSVAMNAAGTTATVTMSTPANLGGSTYTWVVVYENGHWRHQPSDSALDWMGMGADKAITVLTNEGSC